MKALIMASTIAVGLGALGASCGSDDDDAKVAQAHATLLPKSGNTTLGGTATFSGDPGSISLTLTVTGAPEGVHGVHIHETGDCSAADAMSAGGHWNPAMHMHGASGPSSHLGDLGNLTVAAGGAGNLTVSNAGWEIGTGTASDVVGKALVVHAMQDDLATQPTGNSGGRIGCGVIQ